MNLRIGASTLLCGIAASLSLGGCSVEPPITHNWEMTVTVQTPAGIRTASTVMTSGIKQVWSLEGKTGAGIYQAEAAVVTLPSGRRLYVCINQAGVTDGVGMVAPAARSTLSPDELKTWPSTRALTLESTAYPPLVIFGDEGDPQTAKVYDPDDIGGEGSVRRITFQLTDKPLTRRINSYLPWVDAYGKTFSGARSTAYGSGFAPLNRNNFKVAMK